jgi:4-hydroxythreonine-4-phosphate dehydrogenase
MMLPVIAITTGEPAGIGPEISIRAAWEMRAEMRPILIGDIGFLNSVARGIDPSITLLPKKQSDLQRNGRVAAMPDKVEVVDCPLAVPVVPGRLDPRNGKPVLKMLDIAIDGAQQDRFDAIVTAPIQKSTINDAGIFFTGHTEYLAQKTSASQVVMMLSGRTGADQDTSSPPLRVALATTHLPLKDVPAAITFESLSKILAIIHSDLKCKFGIGKPRILVTGLNPHAGEEGYLGREEIDIIAPAIAMARKDGIDASGPYPADTLFQPRFLNNADCVLAMYHDQGLPVLKYASFGRGVNITLGLPIVRTSVDHGTALDMAEKGYGHADYGSMKEALRVAAQMANCAKLAGRHQ